jgi:hypothetical protein
MILDTDASPTSIAIASGLILNALVEALISKHFLSAQEVHYVLGNALNGISSRPRDQGLGAAEVISAFSRRFAQRNL